MQKDFVKKRAKAGLRRKTLKETHRDAKKSRAALSKRVWNKIFKIWGL